jgi:hypothetical protein
MMLVMVPLLALGVSIYASTAQAAEVPPIDWKTFLEELGPDDAEGEVGEELC